MKDVSDGEMEIWQDLYKKTEEMNREKEWLGKEIEAITKYCDLIDAGETPEWTPEEFDARCRAYMGRRAKFMGRGQP